MFCVKLEDKSRVTLFQAERSCQDQRLGLDAIIRSPPTLDGPCQEVLRAAPNTHASDVLYK